MRLNLGYIYDSGGHSLADQCPQDGRGLYGVHGYQADVNR